MPIVGFELSELWLSGETYLILYGPGAARVQLRFGGPARFVNSDGAAMVLDGGGDWTGLVPLFELRHRKVVEAYVRHEGQISLRFDHGGHLSVDPDPQFENWGLSGPDDLILECPPGGGDPRIAGDLPHVD